MRHNGLSPKKTSQLSQNMKTLNTMKTKLLMKRHLPMYMCAYDSTLMT